MKRRISSTLAVATLALLATACSSSDGDTSSPSTGTVQGTVVNAPTPVSGVRIVLSGPGGTYEVTTSSFGTYSLAGVPTGFYTVDVYGDGVYDDSGNTIPDKIDLHLPNVFVNEGVASIAGRPIFLPERGDGTTIDTAGSTVGTIAAGTVISDPVAGVALVFDVETQVTFRSATATTLSMTSIPVEQTPVVLPGTISATSIFAIEPAGAVFDTRPSITFPNQAGLPTGTSGVSLQRLTFDGGVWTEFGTGSVTTDGAYIVSDAGAGPRVTGMYAVGVEPFCATTVTGRVEDSGGGGIAGALVTTVGGRTSMTDANGDFSISNVLLPTSNFNVVVTALPAVNSGFEADESAGTMGACGAPTDVGAITLTALAIDTTAPTISSTFPANEAIDVDDNVALSATFSEAMSPGSLNPSTVRVRANGAAVEGAISVLTNLGQTEVTFVPAELLPTGASCEFRIGANVMDDAGNRLGEATVVSFNTVGTTAGGSASIDATPDAPVALDPGMTQAMSVAVLSASGATINGAAVTWSSDDTSVVRVNANGIVRAVGPGSASVTATFGAISDVVPFTVTAPAVDAVMLTGGQSTAAVGSSFTLGATALDAMANPLQGVSFTWSSSDPAVASVNANGVVRTLAPGGPVTITATEPTSGEDATFAVTSIDPSGVTSVQITAPSTMFGSGSAVQYSARAFDSQLQMLPGVSFVWSSSNPSVVRVNGAGLVTGVGDGMATIRAVAFGSMAVSAEVAVTGFVDTPLVVTVVGGDDGVTGLANMIVIHQDAVTGDYIGEIETGADGVANFGLTNRPRATITVFESPSQSQSSPELFTLMAVPVGSFVIGQDEADALATFDVSASLPSGTSNVTFIAGGPDGGDSFFDGTKGSTLNLSGIEARFVQPDGLASFIALGTEGALSNDPTLSAAFLLDQDPLMLDGSTAGLTLTTGAVTSTAFTSTAPVTPTDVIVRRKGLLFDQSTGIFSAATSGSIAFAMPPQANRVAYAFDGAASQSDAEVTRLLVFASAPTSVEVTMPALDLSPIDFDGDTFSWSASGADLEGLDAGSVQLEFSAAAAQGGFSSAQWGLVFDGMRSDITLPDLGSNYSWIAPASEQTQFEFELIDVDTVNGYDALLSAVRPHATRLERLLLDSAIDASSVGVEQVPASLTVGGADTGTVTFDFGSTSVTAVNGDVVQLPYGASVTVTAVAGSGALVSAFSSSAGTATGVGSGTASLTFDSEFSTFINIDFDTAP